MNQFGIPADKPVWIGSKGKTPSVKITIRETAICQKKKPTVNLFWPKHAETANFWFSAPM